MSQENLLRKNIIDLAKLSIYRTELLMNQCDSWLSEEEGRKNMEKQILKKRKEKTQRKRLLFFH